MKRALVILFLVMAEFSFSQSAENKTGLGIYFGTIQYKGELGDAFFNTGKGNHAAFGISISQYISRSLDLGLNCNYGQVDFTGKNSFMSGTMNSFNLLMKYKFYNGKIFKEDAFLAPYLTAGVGAADYNRFSPLQNDVSDFFIPAGAGLRFRFSRTVNVLMQMNYHISMSDEYDNDFSESGNDAFLFPAAAVVFNIGGEKDKDSDGVKDKKDKCPETPPSIIVDATGCPVDRDGDGLLNEADSCPDAKGWAQLHGCPDKDGDGVADKNDRCPEVAGTVANNGCPEEKEIVKDTVVIQEKLEDKEIVKQIIEIAKEEGEKEKTEAAQADTTIEKEVVKEIIPEPQKEKTVEKEMAAATQQQYSAVHFITGKSFIRKSGFKKLNEIVKEMKEHPELKLIISGHADTTGTAAGNLKLSQRRAEAVSKYLVTHGIEQGRITTIGYGDTVPAGTNTTKAGRAMNRRVEFKIMVE
jgi:outer membrane protein OmpA-like peptidoglycan-associated protein